MLCLSEEAYRGARPHSLIVTIYNKRTCQGSEHMFDYTKEEILGKFGWPSVEKFAKALVNMIYGKDYYLQSYRIFLELERED